MGGAEAVVHCSRAILAQNPTLASLQLDFRNAFNEVERAPILEEVGQHFPSILAWVSFCYGTPSKLHFRSKFLESSRGVQQGDPLGPLLFCLSIQGIKKHPINSTILVYGRYLTFGPPSDLAMPIVKK